MTTIREVFDCASWTPIASFDSERVLRALEWHLNRVLPSTFRELIALENGRRSWVTSATRTFQYRRINLHSR